MKLLSTPRPDATLLVEPGEAEELTRRCGGIRLTYPAQKPVTYLLHPSGRWLLLLEASHEDPPHPQ